MFIPTEKTEEILKYVPVSGKYKQNSTLPNQNTQWRSYRQCLQGRGGKQSTLGASGALAQCKALSMFKKVPNLMPSVLQNGNAQG